METKYGQLPDEMLVAYANGMISKVYKMMPMKESKTETLTRYIESTLREFIGQKELTFKLRDSEEFLTILGIMESLLNQDDFTKFRSDIFKIINLIKKLEMQLGGGKNELSR
jgi:hypothetical protein